MGLKDRYVKVTKPGNYAQLFEAEAQYVYVLDRVITKPLPSNTIHPDLISHMP